MKVKVLIADKFPEKYIEELISYELDVEYNPKLSEKDLPEASQPPYILIIRSTKVNAETINTANKLNLIIRAGAGVNNIDIPAANKRGIYVANCPGKNSVAVAELTIGLMIALDRRIPDNVIDFKNSKWNKAEYSKAEGLKGKTLGIIGVGNIGKEVAQRAIAMGMNVYGTDISRIEGEQIKDFSEMNQLLPLCDVNSIHLPITPETTELFNKDMFGYMKPNTFLINTSRPGVIDEDAMLEAIKEKHLVTPFNAKAMALFPEKIGGKMWSVLTVHTDKPPSKICIASFDNEEEMWSENFWKKWYKNFMTKSRKRSC